MPSNCNRCDDITYPLRLGFICDRTHNLLVRHSNYGLTLRFLDPAEIRICLTYSSKKNNEKIALEALHKLVLTFTNPEVFNRKILLNV